MPEPRVSILLPVYNAGNYLRACIDSLLGQTFEDFELLAIDDGSTDASAQIIWSFSDSRVRYLSNGSNLGLIKTLNLGIAEAKGKYMARMDADDIALPERIGRQYEWLESRPTTAIVASFVEFIDSEGVSAGYWPLDRRVYHAADIRNRLLRENCIAHPTVMGRADIFRQFRYDEHQPHIEDYDFWLRLSSAGETIEKIPEVLLHYRVHQGSVTQQALRPENPFWLRYNCKMRMLQRKKMEGNWNEFDRKLRYFAWLDASRGVAKDIKGWFKS